VIVAERPSWVPRLARFGALVSVGQNDFERTGFGGPAEGSFTGSAAGDEDRKSGHGGVHFAFIGGVSALLSLAPGSSSAVFDVASRHGDVAVAVP
jgi:hypothetical protein